MFPGVVWRAGRHSRKDSILNAGPAMLLDYQTNFALSCPIRGGRAFVTFPKLLLLMSPLGFVNCVWLKMLKNSARISKFIASFTGMILVIPKSVLLKPGPWKNRRLAVPKSPQSAPVKTPATLAH